MKRNDEKNDGKVFSIFEIGQKKCPKLKYTNTLCRKYFFYSIIEFYGLVTEKIIPALLR